MKTLTILLSLILISCAKGGHMPLNNPPSAGSSSGSEKAGSSQQPKDNGGPYFETDFLPVVNRICGVACHGHIAGIPDWTKPDQVKSRLSALLERVVADRGTPRQMPPQGLDEKDFQTVKAFLEHGAQQKPLAPASETVVSTAKSSDKPTATEPKQKTDLLEGNKSISCTKKQDSAIAELNVNFETNEIISTLTSNNNLISSNDFLKINEDNSVVICDTDYADFGKCDIQDSEQSGTTYLTVSCDGNVKIQLTLAIQDKSAHVICRAANHIVTADYDECVTK